MKLLTPEDVADRLQVSVRTVMRHSQALGGFYTKLQSIDN